MPTVPRPAPGARLGARFGVLFGCTAWTLALGAVCLASGRNDLLLPLVLPLLLASLGVGMLVLVPIELLQAPAAADLAPLRLPVVFGAVAVACGLLLLLADGLLVPELQRDPAIAQRVTASGGVLSLPRVVPCLLLAAGCGVLWSALWRASRQRPPLSAS